MLTSAQFESASSQAGLDGMPAYHRSGGSSSHLERL